jgi:hypothetical protein
MSCVGDFKGATGGYGIAAASRNPKTIGSTLGCSGSATTNKTPLQAVTFKWMDTKEVSTHENETAILDNRIRSSNA